MRRFRGQRGGVLGHGAQIQRRREMSCRERKRGKGIEGECRHILTKGEVSERGGDCSPDFLHPNERNSVDTHDPLPISSFFLFLVRYVYLIFLFSNY